MVLFVLGSTRYRFDPQSSRLKKASFEESQHSRDRDGKFSKKDSPSDGGHKADPIVAGVLTPERSGKMLSAFQQGCDKFLEKIDTMSLKRLNAIEADGYISDILAYPIQKKLKQELKAKGASEETLDNFDLSDVIPGWEDVYDRTYDAAESAIESRVERLERQIVGDYIAEKIPDLSARCESTGKELLASVQTMPEKELKKLDPSDYFSRKLFSPVRSKALINLQSKGGEDVFDHGEEILLESVPELFDVYQKSLAAINKEIDKRLERA